MTHRLSPAWMPVVAALTLSIALPTTARSQGLEELVVTARKKEESLQETALSITAFSAEALQEAGALNNYDVALLTPNFNTAAQLGRRLDRPVIRGQAAPAVGGEPNASYFIDGVFVSGSISSATLGPVERVEILRGPQSATFGRATFAGAVNYVTRQPTNEFEGEVRTIAGSNDTYQLGGWGSGPIVEDYLTFFVAAGFDKFGGQWHNDLQDGQAQNLFVAPTAPTHGDSSRLGGTETTDITGKLRFTPSDSTAIDLKLSYTNAEDGHYAQYIMEPGELNCYLPGGTGPTDPQPGDVNYATSQGAYCGSFDIDRVTYVPGNPFADPNAPNWLAGAPLNGESRQSRFNLPDFYEGVTAIGPGDPAQWISEPRAPGAQRDQVRALLQWTQDIGEWGLTTRLAYNNDEFDTAYDLDQRERRPITNVFAFHEKLDVEDQSLEIILDSPQENRVRGSVGTYYFDSETNSRTHSTPGFAIVLDENSQSQFIGLGQFSDPIVTSIENKSVFGSLEYDITELLTFIAEARYAVDKKSIDSPYTCFELGNPYFGERVRDETDESAVTPRFTLNYQATDTVMVYMLTAKGNKPAEFNTGYFRITADPCASLAARDNPASEGGSFTRTKEENAWTYEVGSKTTWFNGRVLANVSAFYIDWTNQATFQTVETGAGVIANIQRNAGKSEVYGLELESSFAITDHFTASLSYGLANGKYKEYDDPFYANTTGIGLDADGNLINGSNNVAGNSIPNNPKHSIITALSYARPINNYLGLFGRTDFILDSKRYVDASNLMTIPNRKIWNARAGLESEKWTATFYVTNILGLETPTAIPNFLYLSDSLIRWNKIDTGIANRNNVETWAASPQRGRNWGVDLLIRFGS